MGNMSSILGGTSMSELQELSSFRLLSFCLLKINLCHFAYSVS